MPLMRFPKVLRSTSIFFDHSDDVIVAMFNGNLRCCLVLAVPVDPGAML